MAPPPGTWAAGAVGGGEAPPPPKLGYRGAFAPCRWHGRRWGDTRGRCSGRGGRQDGFAVSPTRVGCRCADVVGWWLDSPARAVSGG